MAPLSTLITGDKAEIISIKLKGKYSEAIDRQQMKSRIEDIGIRIGKTVEVLNAQNNGPLLLKVNNSRIALGRTTASNIMVDKIT